MEPEKLHDAFICSYERTGTAQATIFAKLMHDGWMMRDSDHKLAVWCVRVLQLAVLAVLVVLLLVALVVLLVTAVLRCCRRSSRCC